MDVINDYAAAGASHDSLEFGDNITEDQLWFRRVGTDLEISVIGTDDNVRISNWYYSGTSYHVETIKTASGMQLLDSQVDSLVSAMAGFAPPAPGQTTLPENYRDALSPVLAQNWK